jgi:hypothetical protein
MTSLSIPCRSILALLLSAPFVIVVTPASPQIGDHPVRTDKLAGPEVASRFPAPLSNTVPFAFGYIEFDVDPSRGMAGFDSWPGLPNPGESDGSTISLGSRP